MMQQLKYTTAGVATACRATDADQVPPSKWRAAMRALIRHGNGNDGMEMLTRKINGLDPMYLGVHEGKQDLKKK
jgi:hypothetical protein